MMSHFLIICYKLLLIFKKDMGDMGLDDGIMEASVKSGRPLKNSKGRSGVTGCVHVI